METKQNSMQTTQKQYSFWVLYVSFFMIYLGRTLIMPLLTFYCDAIWSQEKKDPNAKTPDTHQGILASFFYISFAIAGLTYGPLSNRIGRRSVILICLAGLTIGMYISI